MINKKKLQTCFSLMIVIVIFFFMGGTIEAATTQKLNKTSVLLKVGKTVQLSIDNASQIKWSSKKESIATVDQNGLVTGKKAGATTITATIHNKQYQCKIQVYQVNTGNKEIDKKMTAVIKSEIKPSMNTIQKIKAIHDWIILNCEYDYDNYLNGTIPTESYTMQGLLLKGRAVCAGYTQTFSEFMRSLGIACKEVSGTGNGGNHAWNMVKVNGKWSWIDVTWDDPVPDTKGQILYNYFMLSDKELKKDHWWTSGNLPTCNTKQSEYYEKIVQICNSEKEFFKLLDKQYQAGKNKLTVYMKKSMLDKLIINAKQDFFVTCKNYGVPLLKYNMTYGNYMGDIIKLEFEFSAQD